MGKKLEGKVAIVTGASKGIGAGIAKHLALEGATVVVNYATSQEDAEKVVSEIAKSGGKAEAIRANIDNEQDIKRLFEETKKKFGKLDILVNNAGVYELFPIEELKSESFHKMFNLNVLGLLLATKEAVKYFGEKGGSIVNIGSLASQSRNPNASVYSATKACVNTITGCLGTELGARKIRVNAVCPGLVETEGTHSSGFSEKESDFRKRSEANTPLGRIGLPEDIAPAVAFLASDEASWITGETLYIAGGSH